MCCPPHQRCQVSSGAMLCIQSVYSYTVSRPRTSPARMRPDHVQLNAMSDSCHARWKSAIGRRDMRARFATRTAAASARMAKRVRRAPMRGAFAPAEPEGESPEAITAAETYLAARARTRSRRAAACVHRPGSRGDTGCVARGLAGPGAASGWTSSRRWPVEAQLSRVRAPALH